MPPSPRIVSVSTALFDGYPMERAIAEIAQAGCCHVEPAFISGYVDFDEDAFLPMRAAALRRLAQDAGLGLHAVSAHLDLSVPSAREALLRRIHFTGALGAAVLITNSGPALAREDIQRTIEAVLPELECSGVTLALENPGHGSGNLTGTMAQAADFLRTIASPHVRINHDAGNVFTYSREARQPASDFATAPDLVAYAHLKDVQVQGSDWTFCELGAGKIDFNAYWKAIPSDLPLSIELPLRLRRPNRADPQRQTEVVPIETIRTKLASSLTFIASLEASVGENEQETPALKHKRNIHFEPDSF